MRTTSVLGIAIIAGALASGAAYAGGDPATKDATAPAPSSQPVPVDASVALAIRAMALGFAPLPVTSMEFETVKAPTGAGIDRMPSATTEIARGVYITVMPSCLPGMDDPLRAPVSRRAGVPVRR